jgi:hypothetical protein
MGLKIEQLLEDEVEWELLYRKIGFRKEDRLGDKQRFLRTSLRATAKGAPEVRCELGEMLDLEEERNIIRQKYNKIEESLREKGSRAKDFGTFESRLIHLERRAIALCRAEKDPTGKQEVAQLLLEIRSLFSKFFGGDETSKVSAGLTSQNDIFDLNSDQAQSENDTSKGAIKKGTMRGTTESTDQTKGQGKTLGKENTKENEERLKKMLSETEDRIQKSETESSEDEMEALLKLQESLTKKIELVRSKKQTNTGWKHHETFSGPKLKLKYKFQSSAETSDSDNQYTPLMTKIKAKAKRREKSSEDEKGLRVEKWGFRYSSTGGLSLVEFLRRVERYKETQNVSDESLVRKAFFLFEGVALDWYDENRHRFKKWKDVVKGLRSAFVAEDNDFLVRQKCEGRKQQSHETFEVYLAQMSKLFQGLSYKITDQEKFEIVKRNVKSSHRLGIALLQVENLEELKNACRCLDGMDSSLFSLATDSPNSRQQTQGRSQVLEIDQLKSSDEDQKETKGKSSKTKKNKKRAQKEKTEKTVASMYQHPERNASGFRDSQSSGGQNRKFYSNNKYKFQRRPQNNSSANFSEGLNSFLQSWSTEGRSKDSETRGQGAGNHSQPLNASAHSFQPKASNIQTRVEPVNENGQVVCWNCDGFNHHQKFCRAPRRVICWGCGRKDTYRDTCPTCSGNGQQRLNKGARQSQ